MSPFDDDIFGNDDFFGISSIFNKLMQGGNDDFYETSTHSPGRKTIRKKYFGKNQENLMNTVEDNNFFYLIFNFPEAEKKDIAVNITDEVVKNDFGKKIRTGNKLLEINIADRKILFALPKKLNCKIMDWSFKNSILEIKIKK